MDTFRKAAGGIGLRGGAGETQLEMDQRSLKQRIDTLQKRLNKLVVQRKQQRKMRHQRGTATVAIVGYTNAGKTTLLNTLTQAKSIAKNQLFVTLDPSAKQCCLPYIGQTVIVDTVGFIQDLPHELVAAFRATLEETTTAQLLLHVVDSVHHNVKQTIQSVNEVLRRIHAHHIPTLLVCNKIDANDQLTPRIDYDQTGCPYRVWITAKNHLGIDLLIQAMIERLTHDWYHCCVTLCAKEAKLRAQLYDAHAVMEEKVTANGKQQLTLTIKPALYHQLID
jgi:GTP-binding protein HflX